MLSIKSNLKLKKYLVIMLILFVSAISYLRKIEHIAVLTLLLIAILFNHWVLLKFVHEALGESGEDSKKTNGILLFLKLIFLILAFYIGIQFMKDGLLILVTFYLLMLTNFILNLKRE